MKEELLCMTSDAVNRYGIRVHVTAMEKMVKEVFDEGRPLLLGHDFHRPVGWSVPFALFMESHLARMMARKIVATNKEDMQTIRKSVNNFLGKQYHDRFIEKGETFLSSIAPFVSGKESRIDTGCLAVVDDNIAFRVFEGLFGTGDEDGLIPVKNILEEFTYLSQGVFKHNSSDFCVFAHEFFRRSQSRFNNFHFFFLDAFMELVHLPECTLRIRLDRHILGHSPSFQERGEFEFHYGPKYTDDITQIKAGIARYQTTTAERMYHGISATEFYWKKDHRELTFELEELRDEPSPQADEQYHCRYIHSIYNKERQTFVHFDGAMRSYNTEEMTNRLDKTFVEYGRKGHYKKLFRIDGVLPLQKWKSLITHYLQGNPLIYEYFGLKEEHDSLKIPERVPSTYEKLLPFDMKMEDGLKIMFSYHTVPDDLQTGRYIDIYDVMSSDTEKLNCLEHLVIELKNAFRLAGENLAIRDDIVYVKFDDPFLNFPSIMHNGEKVEEMLQKSVEVIGALLQAMLEKGLQPLVSLTLSFVFNNRVIRISSYGHIQHQVNWLQNSFPITFSETGITDWVEAQRDYLNQFSVNIDPLLMLSLMQTDGVLFIKRIPVQYPYKYELDDFGIKSVISFPATDDGTLQLVNENKIKPVVCIRIEKAFWSDTKEDYFTACRSKWIGEGKGYVEIHQAAPLALYWSKPFADKVKSEPATPE